MIVLTLGTASFQFDRAINWLSILLESGIISEPVFVQYGVSDISPVLKHPLVTAQSVLELEPLLALIDTARLVISHAGQGSTRMLAARGASFVLLPRLKSYAEHIDDHQLWFAQAIEELGVQYCSSLKQLEQAILQPPSRFPKQLFCEPKLANHLLTVHPAETLMIST